MFIKCLNVVQQCWLVIESIIRLAKNIKIVPNI